MQQELTRLLRAVPFAPFIIFTRDGKELRVTGVECLAVGLSVCAYLDGQGYISVTPYTAIDRVSTKNGPELS